MNLTEFLNFLNSKQRKIRIKRGVKETLPVLDIGEPAITLDANNEEFYIGTENGNILINDHAKGATKTEASTTNGNIIINDEETVVYDDMGIRSDMDNIAKEKANKTDVISNGLSVVMSNAVELEALVKTGFYSIATASSPTGFPMNVLNVMYNNDAYQTQFGIGVNQHKAVFRHKNSGIWGDWDEIWHSGNLNNTGQAIPLTWDFPVFLNGVIRVDLRYAKDLQGNVFLKGTIMLPASLTSGSTMFTLPVNYRPQFSYSRYQPINTGGVFSVSLTPDGNMVLNQAHNSGVVYMSFDTAFKAEK